MRNDLNSCIGVKLLFTYIMCTVHVQCTHIKITKECNVIKSIRIRFPKFKILNFITDGKGNDFFLICRKKNSEMWKMENLFLSETSDVRLTYIIISMP